MRHPEPTLTQTIRDLRLRHGWSQRRLAIELGVDHATVGRWESGSSGPTATLRQRLEILVGPTLSPGTTVLGSEIRDLRHRLGLSQAELSTRLGMTQPTLSRIENGSLRPSPELSRALRDFLGRPQPLDTLPNASLDECEASYEAYWRACAVFDHPEGAVWGEALTQRLQSLAEADMGAKRLLARVYASRSYWHLARGQHRDAERMACSAIRLGIEVGFDLTSGYAFWAWTRCRFQKQRILNADRQIVRNLRNLSRRYAGPELPYAELIAATYERITGRLDESLDRLDALSEQTFPEDEPGQFGDLDVERRWATIQSYRAMFRLAEKDDEGVLTVVEAIRNEDPIVCLIVGAYRNAALARLGGLPSDAEAALTHRAQAAGHGFAYRTVLDHVDRIARTVR